MNKPQLPKVLRQIARGEISRGQAAKKLGATTRTVNRYMKAAGISRPEPAYLKRRKIARTRKEFKAQMKNKTTGLSIEAIMKVAGISRRTAYRWQNGQ